MYIRRKVFSVALDEAGEEKLFSTCDIINEDDYLQEMMYSEEAAAEEAKEKLIKRLAKGAKALPGKAWGYAKEHPYKTGGAALGAAGLAGLGVYGYKKLKKRKAEKAESYYDELEDRMYADPEVADAVQEVVDSNLPQEQKEKLLKRLAKGLKAAPGKAWGYAKEHPYKTAAGVAGAAGLTGLGVYGYRKLKNRKAKKGE